MNTNQQLTIRGVDKITKQRLVALARKRGMSLNSYNLELLRQNAGTNEADQSNGLERFAGLVPSLDPRVEEALKNQRKPTKDKWDTYGV